MASISDYLEFLPGVPDPALTLVGHYNASLVALSILIAIFSSYAAVYVADQVKSSAGPLESAAWLAVGSLAMGGGMWSMHFVGMLAFQLPCVVHYDATATAAP
ncbi:MHYT domain-containing protein [Methylogaea oryzae]|uniref:MHYT domain-containing protein n=1 Tax=Methylogaea oryzae TaxID=1295382 RepID=UPI0006CF6827|nr:MHYT domain-containing protein [Methylogaea oryzae]